mmetsp:Transcript_1663/g.5795  ORF Transcript_1663/g.5795 Transcript_1663/m.5795 type:complete len:858 (+) Transcript_1663:4083-6656(+)
MTSLPPHSISFLESLSHKLTNSNEPLSLKYLEQSIYLRWELFGEDVAGGRGGVSASSSPPVENLDMGHPQYESSSPNVSDTSSLIESFIIRCNLLAMRFLKAENYVMALEYLKKAQWMLNGDTQAVKKGNQSRISQRHSEAANPAPAAPSPPNFLSHRPLLKLKLLAATWNNLACFFKRRGKLRMALEYMEKALKVEMKMRERNEWVRRRIRLNEVRQSSAEQHAPTILHDAQNISVENPAATHLNICAILSQMGKHRRALVHAKDALKCLDEEDQMHKEMRGFSRDAPPKASRRDPSMKAVAFHNLAVEYEFLGKPQQSKKYYRDAVHEARQTLGITHPTTDAIQNSFKNAFPDEILPGTEECISGGVQALTYRGRNSLQSSPKKRQSFNQNASSRGGNRRRLSNVPDVGAPHGTLPPPRRRASQPGVVSGRQKKSSSLRGQQARRRHTVSGTQGGTLPNLQSKVRRERESVTSGGLPSLLSAPGKSSASDASRPPRGRGSVPQHGRRASNRPQDLVDRDHPDHAINLQSFNVQPSPPTHPQASRNNPRPRRSQTPTLTEKEFADEPHATHINSARAPVPASGAPSHRTPRTPTSSQRTPMRKPRSTKLRPITPNSYSPATRRRRLQQTQKLLSQGETQLKGSVQQSDSVQDKAPPRKRRHQAPQHSEGAATNIQRAFRGYISRKRLRQQRAIEKSYELVGGTPRSVNSPKGDYPRPPIAPMRSLPLSQLDSDEYLLDDFSEDEQTTPPAVYNHLMNISATLDNLKQSLSVENSFAADGDQERAHGLEDNNDDFSSFNEEFSLSEGALNEFGSVMLEKKGNNVLDDLEDFAFDGEISSIDDAALAMDRVASPPPVE